MSSHGSLALLFLPLLLLSPLLAAMTPLTRADMMGLEGDLEGDLEDVNGSFNRGPTDSAGVPSSCCVREKKMKNIGVTEGTGEDVVVDVGHCRRRCAKKKLKRKEFERLMRENPDMDPTMLFLAHTGEQRGGASCSGGQICLPSASRVERVATREGIASVTVTEECECRRRPHTCRRQPRPVTLHKDTPLQTTVDIGDCQGHCSHDLGCKVTKSKTVSIEGPNGAECVNVAEECGCEGSCYRAARQEHVYNYTSPGDPQVQVIDVGTCVGECDTIPGDRCVLRESDGGCLMSLTQRSSRCSPTGRQYVQVTQRDGSVRSLSSITHCGCQ